MQIATLRIAIAQEARTWVGTPFHHAAAIKGAGVDCIALLLTIYDVIKVKKAIPIPAYKPNWFLHHNDEILLDFIKQYGLIEVAKPEIGDVAAIKFGRSYSHIAIMLDETQCVHACDQSKQVMIANVTQHPFVDRAIKYFSVWKT
jgi:cell wall-associated NlpC family hydrolase